MRWKFENGKVINLWIYLWRGDESLLDITGKNLVNIN